MHDRSQSQAEVPMEWAIICHAHENCVLAGYSTKKDALRDARSISREDNIPLKLLELRKIPVPEWRAVSLSEVLR